MITGGLRMEQNRRTPKELLWTNSKSVVVSTHDRKAGYHIAPMKAIAPWLKEDASIREATPDQLQPLVAQLGYLKELSKDRTYLSGDKMHEEVVELAPQILKSLKTRSYKDVPEKLKALYGILNESSSSRLQKYNELKGYSPKK